MLNSSTSVWLGITFVLIGAINVCLILQASARVKDAKASALLIAGHRIGGYLFISVFCVMGYFMVARLGDVESGASPGTMIHLTLAMVLSPLLFVKVLVGRYYKSYHSLLMPQPSDSKTLRFIVPNERKLSARPGQFLTFSFLFDGKKVTRSYSICSSPARSGYVEITPKRVSQGCASVFLNDRASVGMTFEANGPFGHFCFDESKHRSVVLLAARSGITPMMAMLRYMDDLCLETTVTLLYCVRTSTDINFESELEQLRSRLKNFQYHVLLSKPHAEWSGPRGHVSREFIEDTVKDLASADFFLCGPPSFMGASRTILAGLGVKPERIGQESFGSTVTKNLRQDSVAQTGAVVEFVRSGKRCTVRSGQTVLEAAEEQGVPIPVLQAGAVWNMQDEAIGRGCANGR